nr:MAG TPA: Pyrimidine dimer DNA glycosylase [Bacteriophage sp.]
MRLWHYDLLDVLPKQQLCSQLRECVAIAKDIYEKGTTNHILINPIMNYDLNHFRLYCNLVIKEMEKRGYNVSDKTKDKLNKYVNYYKGRIRIPIRGEKRILILNCNEDKYESLFGDWHTSRYLKQCLYNLEEKYDRGGITHEEWDKICDKYFNKCIESKR